jgi:hypothetical protein
MTKFAGIAAAVEAPTDSAIEKVESFSPDLLSLLKATVVHRYITETNIAKKEVSPTRLFKYINTHVGFDDFCGGPVRQPMLGMISRQDYIQGKFNRAAFFTYNNCPIYGDFEYFGLSRRGVLKIKATDIKQEALLTTPYKIIMDKLKKSYPKKGHTMLDVDPETDGIMIKSDVLFEGKRHHIVKWIGGQRVN